MSSTIPPPPRGRTRRAALAVIAVATVYVVLLLALLAPGGGLHGRYLVAGHGGVEALVHERLDPQIDFSVPQRLDAAYVFHWNQRRLGDFPRDSMPPYLIHWTGLLQAPRAGTYGFALDVHGDARLSIDGAPLETRPDTITERDLTEGWHAVVLDYTLAVQGDARLVLSWRPPGESLRPVPSAVLAPDGEAVSREARRRVLALVLLASGLIVCGLFVWLARRPGGAAARLLDHLKAERVTLALGSIVLLAAILRFHDYALVPFHHETADEYQHAWEGWTLLHEGMPKAWSTFPDRYPMEQTRDFRWFGDRYILVWPYFDHPPLFSVLLGVVVSLVQPATYQPPWDFLSCTLPMMRVVPIVLSLIGILLLYRLAKEYGASERAALLGALVYATLPVIVLAHRLVKAESLLSILFMGAILAVHRHDRSGRARDAVLAGALAGLSIWCKATGVAVLAVVLVLLRSRRRRRGAWIVLAVASGSVLLYLLYAWALDFGIFMKIIQAQATTKWVGVEALQDLLSGKIVTKYFGRGWYLWLLLCAAVAALRRERGLLLPLAVYGTVIAMTGDLRVIYGWYRIPLYPFLCVAAGVVLEEMLEEADLYRVFPFAIAAVSTGVLYALPDWAGGVESGRLAVYLFALLALAPFLARLAFDREPVARLARLSTWCLLLVFFVTSLVTVDRLLEIYSATRGVR